VIYFLLLIHFIGNVIVIMVFGAFIGAIAQQKTIEKLAIICLTLYSLLELSGVILLIAFGDETMLWPVWLLAVLVTLIISFVLFLFRKMDISIWGVFSIIFAPLIIIPVLFFILANRKLFVDNSELS